MFPTRRQAAMGLAGLAGLVATPAWSQAVGEELPEVADETPTTVGLTTSRFEHMLAPVGINGQGPFHFLLDTGANVSCISRSLAERLELPAGPNRRVHTVVGAQIRPSVVIPHLQIGARNRRGVRAPALPMRQANVDGVLGVDWLKGQRLVLGFKAKSLEITTSKREATTENRVVVPARRRQGQLTIVDAELSGRSISAMIDTGSQVTMCNGPLRRLVLEIESRRPPKLPHQIVRLESIAGETFTGELMYLPFLRLGGLQLGNVPAVYADMHVFDIWGLKETPALVLGMDLLGQFEAVAVDYGRSHVRFDIA